MRLSFGGSSWGGGFGGPGELAGERSRGFELEAAVIHHHSSSYSSSSALGICSFLGS